MSIEPTINKLNRSADHRVTVASDEATGFSAELKLSVYHAKKRKHYCVSMVRVVTGDGFVEFAPMEDTVIIDMVPTNRYSEKKLRELFEANVHRLDDPSWIEWAGKSLMYGEKINKKVA